MVISFLRGTTWYYLLECSELNGRVLMRALITGGIVRKVRELYVGEYLMRYTKSTVVNGNNTLG